MGPPRASSSLVVVETTFFLPGQNISHLLAAARTCSALIVERTRPRVLWISQTRSGVAMRGGYQAEEEGTRSTQVGGLAFFTCTGYLSIWLPQHGIQKYCVRKLATAKRTPSCFARITAWVCCSSLVIPRDCLNLNRNPCVVNHTE